MMSTSTLVTRSGRKAKGDGHQRRSEILQAAERIFLTSGYEGATIRRIADEVGIVGQSNRATLLGREQIGIAQAPPRRTQQRPRHEDSE